MRTCLALALSLTASACTVTGCGEGANSRVTGVVALGAPLQSAQIELRCAAGQVPAVQTNARGEFSVETRGVQWPCLVRASGGTLAGAPNTVRLHGLAQRGGPVLLDPLGELALAHALAVPPSQAFDANDVPAPAASLVAAGQDYVLTQLRQLALSVPADAKLFDATVAPDAARLGLQQALADRLALSQHRLGDLAAGAATRRDWAPLLVAVTPPWTWELPEALVEPVVPADNPMSAEKVELGRFLFYDTRLSVNGKTSCGTCHQQAKAFTDGKTLAVGTTDEVHPRNAQTIGNVVYNPTLTWAHLQPELLEHQLEAPMFGTHPVEMGLTPENRLEAILRLQADAGYQARFPAAFPNQDNPFSWANVAKAIAAFERTVLTGDSRYDLAKSGRGPALTDSESRGASLFFTHANCFRCHGNFNFTDALAYRGGPAPELRFHNTGLFNVGGTGAFPEPNRGIYEITKKDEDMGKFRAPSLRNIAVTGPYMHDGSMATLEEVLDFYANGGRNITSGPLAGDGRLNPHKSDIVNDIKLTAQDKQDLVAFMRTLTDEKFLSNPKLSDPFR